MIVTPTLVKMEATAQMELIHLFVNVRKASLEGDAKTVSINFLSHCGLVLIFVGM